MKQELQSPKLIDNSHSPVSHCMFLCNQQIITCMSTNAHKHTHRVFLPSPDFIFSLHLFKEAAVFSTLPPEGSWWTNIIKQQNTNQLNLHIIMQIIQCLDISPHFITAILLWETCRTTECQKYSHCLLKMYFSSREIYYCDCSYQLFAQGMQSGWWESDKHK